MIALSTQVSGEPGPGQLEPEEPEAGHEYQASPPVTTERYLNAEFVAIYW